MNDDPTQPLACSVLRVLAYAQLQNNQPDNARTLLSALTHFEQLDDRSLAMKALAELRCGHPDVALATLDVGGGTGMEMALFDLIRAQAYMRQGQPALARAAMRRYVATRGPAAPSPSPT